MGDDTYLFLHPGVALQLSSDGLLIRCRIEIVSSLEESLSVTVLISGVCGKFTDVQAF